MLFVFEVKVLEVFEGFRAWFQQSFWTFELKISSRCLGPFKCLRKASIYKSLEVGERHVAESDW